MATFLTLPDQTAAADRPTDAESQHEHADEKAVADAIGRNGDQQHVQEASEKQFQPVVHGMFHR